MPLLADSLRNLASMMLVGALTLAALYYGQDILVPIAVATILAFILAPIVNRMNRAGITHSVSVTLAVVAAVTITAIALVAFSSQLLTLAANLDGYQPNFVEKVRTVTATTGEESSLSRAAATIERLQKDLVREVSPEGAAAGPLVVTPSQSPDRLSALQDFAAAVAAPVGKALLTILFAFFLLLQHHDLRERVIRVAGTDNISNTTAAIAEAGSRLSSLFLAQAILNGGFGIFVGVALWAIGIPNAVLWGIVAAVMRFVPFIGSFVAAIPPLLLAAGVEPGWSTLAMTLALFVIGEPLMGHIVEPLVLGKRAGLTPFAIVVALSVWTLLWGPMGLLLAVPLTLAIVVLGRYVPGLEFLSVLLGDEEPLTPAQRFYNRLLSKDASAAISQIQECAEERTISAVTDDVVLPALQAASLDYILDRLDTQHVAALSETMSLVTEAFEDAGGLESVGTSSTHATSVLVIPARGPIDVMAAGFLGSVVNSLTPYQTRASVSSGLTALAAARASIAKTDDKPAIVIATTGAGDSAQLRLIVNRAATTFPGNPVFIVGSDMGRQASASLTEQSASANVNWTTAARLVELLRAHHPSAAEPHRQATEKADA
jgi:predicted PurR-regulated permease PerM